MRLKNEGGFGLSMLKTLLVFGLMCLLAMLMALIVRHGYYRGSAKQYFGLSVVSTLSIPEKTMLSPMVKSVLEGFNLEVVVAKRRELNLLSRQDITQDNADQAVKDLREAQKQSLKAQDALVGACKTARFFSLTTGDFKWCK